MRSLAECIARYRARFCYVDETYCVQQPVWHADAGVERGGHYLRAYADPQTKERPLPLTDALIERHLRGQATLAFYTAKRVGDETLCREGIVECDDKRAIPDPSRTQPGRVRHEPVNGRALMRDAHLRLEREGIPSALELSRRGARVRIVAAAPVPARAMQNLLLLAIGAEERERMARGEPAVEINPKQDALGPGKVGNSVRGPFGIHLKSGERYPFIRPDGRPVGATLGAQLAYILDVPAVDVMRELERRPWLEQERPGTLDRLPEPARARTVERPAERTERIPRLPGRLGVLPIEHWKEAHPLAEVLADYGVAVAHSGTYRCPLPHHGRGDRRPSLSVDVERGVWFCHTAAIGGSAFDFLMAAEGLTSPSEAVAYLRGRGELAPTVIERDGGDWGSRA